MKSKKKFIVIISMLIIISAFYYVFKINYSSRGAINNIINKIQGKTLNKEFKTKIKCGNLATDYNIAQVLSDIDKFQFNTINVPVAITVDSLSASNMTVDKASESKAIELIKKLNRKKVNIILEPYPWIDNGSKYETDWKPNNINEFFINWRNNALKVLIDDIAVPYHVDAVYIGSNFVHMEADESEWCDTVDYVRKYYKGLVTYRTNKWSTAKWEPKTITSYKNKLNNKLFSKLDFISIAAYFEITNNDENTVDNLVSAIESSQIYDRKQNIKKEIKNFHDKWNKPIFLGELGFPKLNGASIEPWNPDTKKPVNDMEQAKCFEAYRRVFENENWFLGFSVFAVGEKSSDKRYYPSEESAKVIRNWYSKVNK